MKRILKLLLILVFLGGAGAAGAWFYVASHLQAQVNSALDELKTNLQYQAVDLKYGDISVSGFPMQFEVAIPEVILEKSTSFPKAKIVFDESVLLRSDLTATNMVVQFASKAAVRITFSESEKPIDIEYLVDRPATMLVELVQPVPELLFTEWKQLHTLAEKIQLKALRYQEPPAKLVNSGTGQLFYSHQGTDAAVVLSQKDVAKTNVAVDYKLKDVVYGEAYDALMSAAMGLPKSNVNPVAPLSEELHAPENVVISFVYDGPDLRKKGAKKIASGGDAKLQIKQIAYVNGQYAINMDGEWEMRSGAAFPKGWQRVQILNLGDWLGLIAKNVQETTQTVLDAAKNQGNGVVDPGQAMMAGMASAIVTPGQMKEIEKFVKWIADAPEAEPHVLLVAYTDESGALLINQKSLDVISAEAEKVFGSMPGAAGMGGMMQMLPMPSLTPSPSSSPSLGNEMPMDMPETSPIDNATPEEAPAAQEEAQLEPAAPQIPETVTPPADVQPLDTSAGDVPAIPSLPQQPEPSAANDAVPAMPTLPQIPR